MIIKRIEIEKFRSFESASFSLGKRLTAIAGRNATQKTTVLGMLGQPFSISKAHPMYGCRTIDGYNYRSQFKDKFKLSTIHDRIGEHKWKLILKRGIHTSDYYSVESIPRRQRGREATLRFWNSESRASGAGYIQLPVYFLSLSRLYPIGEAGKTQSVQPDLTQEELEYYITNYRTILSIQSIGESPTVCIEKGSSSKVYSGISDDTHDVFTNSAGECNISRIILAVLSFKRLRDSYGTNYKGGILLIDEIDATLHGYSQSSLIDYLWRSAKDFSIQIIFTTHSPIVLKRVNKYLRDEREKKGIRLPVDAYDSSIVYLEPKYDDDGRRTIVPRNILSSSELSVVLNDINLSLPESVKKVNVYCEDSLAIEFVNYALSRELNISATNIMKFVDINLGWTNYIQLASKKVPEFINNVIVLDEDVLTKDDYNEQKQKVVQDSGNIVFLPLTIEKDMFELLKKHDAFNRFTQAHCQTLSFDVCFNNWPLESEKYKTEDFKKWFAHTQAAVGEVSCLLEFWCNENQVKATEFATRFRTVFNILAERQGLDSIPLTSEPQEVPED